MNTISLNRENLGNRVTPERNVLEGVVGDGKGGDVQKTLHLMGDGICEGKGLPVFSENTVSLVVGGKTLYLFNLFDPDNPIELAFQSRYGNIVSS